MRHYIIAWWFKLEKVGESWIKLCCVLNFLGLECKKNSGSWSNYFPRNHNFHHHQQTPSCISKKYRVKKYHTMYFCSSRCCSRTTRHEEKVNCLGTCEETLEEEWALWQLDVTTPKNRQPLLNSRTHLLISTITTRIRFLLGIPLRSSHHNQQLALLSYV